MVPIADPPVPSVPSDLPDQSEPTTQPTDQTWKGWGLPPGPNVGTQLKAKRAAAKRAAKKLEQNADPQSSEMVDSEGEIQHVYPRHPQPRTAQEWFASKEWTTFTFQQQVWDHMAAGRSGLLHATTGSGKTFAVWLGVLNRYLQLSSVTKVTKSSGLRALWITPMRALASDTTRALSEATAALGIDWMVEQRTGDTQSAQRARQAKQLPQALVTTPESLSLMLARADAQQVMCGTQVVVIDEWHELVGNKRGTQTLLALARLKQWNPQLIVWGLSATLGNLPHALDALLGASHAGVLVQGAQPKEIVIDTLLPQKIERFSWGGHLGVSMLKPVIEQIEQHGTCLIFTNTRSQAEIWYQSLLEQRPDWAGVVAIHHGSLDKSVRDWVEQGLKQGRLKAVVCTSSLDLGVDFLPVERVLQIGSPKGVARLLQRAGRSGHAPGRASRVTVVPTNALDVVEAAAARVAVQQKKIEPRTLLMKPLDVLVQHLVTVALGGGFTPNEMYAEVCTASPYVELTREEFEWCLGFVRGGGSLEQYQDYHRIEPDELGVLRVPRADIARRHRMSIGTIVSDSAMQVAWATTLGRIGTIEESFISRLKIGDCFTFAGRALQLVRVRDMTAYVQKAPKNRGTVPQWQGGKMPLSSELAHATLGLFDRASRQDWSELELQCVAPILKLQQQWSGLPGADHLLCEVIQSKEGYHFYCYAFAGYTVHTGLAALVALRASRNQPDTFSLAMNDYGFELFSATPFEWEQLIAQGLFSPEHVLEDVLQSLNASQLAQRKFRVIARVAGLVFQGYPGAHKSTKQLQASSSLFFEVFSKYDPDNLLLQQARIEALEQELEVNRLREVLQRMGTQSIRVTYPQRFTPLAFPLMVERLRETVSTDKLSTRLQKLIAELEQAANP